VTNDFEVQLDMVGSAIARALAQLSISGKMGKGILQPRVGGEIEKIGFTVDYEDTKGFLESGVAVWRSKETHEIESTAARRLIDLVVYDGDRPIALIETESDLNDLRETGVSRRCGHYDVYSIAKDALGAHFHSYKSLERMATAAFFHAARLSSSFDRFEALKRLMALASNSPEEHNPEGLGLFLVTGRCRNLDRRILAPRLKSLNATLVAAVQR
jgi:hypothetical protein